MANTYSTRYLGLEAGRRITLGRDKVKYNGIEFHKGSFILWRIGAFGIPVHVEALHVVQPGAEFNVALLCDYIVLKTDCSSIVADVSRGVVDLNRPIVPQDPLTLQAANEYRATIKTILARQGFWKSPSGLVRPYLHLSLHGMQDCTSEVDIDIATRGGKFAGQPVIDWFVDLVTQKTGFKIGVEKTFQGREPLEFLRRGDPQYPENTGYGANYNVLALEIAKKIRREEPLLKQLAEALIQAILQFGRVFHN